MGNKQASCFNTMTMESSGAIFDDEIVGQANPIAINAF